MHINPDSFWDMSIQEITLAIDGFREYNTGKTSDPMNMSDLDNLKEQYPDY